MKLFSWKEIDICPVYFKVVFILFLSAMLIHGKVNAQGEYDVISNKWLQYSDAPNSLYHYISGQAYILLDQRAREIKSLTSLHDWQERQKKISETLMDIVGPFPGKTPLNAKITRVIEKDSYRVEHIIYESQPGFYVTSSLFIPQGLIAKAPVVIYCSGHSNNGYRYKSYQETILNLVDKGFIVFAFDPVGQGERLEYFDPNANISVIGDPDKQHSYSGTQAFITGSSQARYMIWDGIRAVDYLFTRKEVDTLRIGITGRSGGGTQSAYIAAMDNRILAAAPECYITNFTRLFQSIGNQDAEQNFYHGIIRGIDHADLFMARAPKPALLIATTRDMFSIQGARETEQEVSRIYKIYGQEENFSISEDDAPHASTKKNREAMYSFFQKQLNNPGSPTDHTYPILTEEEMLVSETGQVSTSYKAESVFSLNRKEAEQLVKKQESSARDIPVYIPGVLNSAKKLSGYQSPLLIEEPVFTGRTQMEDYTIEKYFLKVEGDYIIPYLLFVPLKSNNKAIIYLHPSGKAAGAAPGGEMEWFVKKGFTVLAPDLIGTGETGPGIFEGDSYIDSVSHNLWYASILIGRSIVGIRAGDVVRFTKLLKQNTAINEIYGVAIKEMSPVLLHAAAFNQDIVRIALIEPLSSYQSIVTNEFYKSSYIHGAVAAAIGSYDLPDLAASLAPRKLVMAGVRDGNGKSLNPGDILDDLSIIKKTYQYKKAEQQFKIITLKEGEKPFDIYSEWIK